MAKEGISFEEVQKREAAIEKGNMERGTGITRTQFEKRYPPKGMGPEEIKKLEAEYKVGWVCRLAMVYLLVQECW